MAIRDTLVALGGGEHRLRWSLSAWAAVEDYGYTMDSILGDMAKTLSMKAVSICLWAMLQEEDPRPSLAQVRSWVDGENFGVVVAKMGDAIRAAFPEAPPNPPPAAPT